MSRTLTPKPLFALACLLMLATVDACKGHMPPPYDMPMEEDLPAPDDLTGADMTGMPDLRAPVDMSMADLAPAEDLRVPDLAMPPVDMSMPDLAMPPMDMRVPDLAMPPMDMSMPDLSVPDMSIPDMRVPDMRMPDMATPPDMATCTGSASCGGGTPFCCAEIVLGAGTPPMCPVTSATIACRATCNGDIALTCNVTDRARLCNKGADCAGDPGGYKNCCQFAAGMLSANVCITDFLKLFAGPCVP